MKKAIERVIADLEQMESSFAEKPWTYPEANAFRYSIDKLKAVIADDQNNSPRPAAVEVELSDSQSTNG